MSTVRLEEQSGEIAALVRQTEHGEEIVFTVQHQPVAKLVPVSSGGPGPQPRFGYLQSKIWLAPDFDAPIDALNGSQGVKPLTWLIPVNEFLFLCRRTNIVQSDPDA